MSDKLPAVLDIEALTAPISSDQPCGTLREHGEDNDLVVAFAQLGIDFDMARRIERARTELDLLPSSQRQAALQNAQGRPDSPAESPPWQRIVDQAETILSKHSKDLRVVAWLVEAACRVKGFVGLRDALDVCGELIDRYGEQLFPMGDSPDDKLYRLGPVKNLNGSSSLIAAIKQVPFIPGTGAHYFGYEIGKYLQSLDPEEQKAQRELGKLTLDDFSIEIIECDSEDIETYQQQLAEAITAAERVDQQLRDASGAELYNVSKVIDQLKQIVSWFKALCAERPEQASDAAAPGDEGSTASGAASASTASANVAGAGAAAGVNISFRTREEALASLLKVAKFFRTTEPHSPLSYSLEQAVRWGRMDLPDLLKDLVADNSVLSEVYRRMGIQEKEENS